MSDAKHTEALLPCPFCGGAATMAIRAQMPERVGSPEALADPVRTARYEQAAAEMADRYARAALQFVDINVLQAVGATAQPGVESFNLPAGWVMMGVSDGSRNLFVYGPYDAIKECQRKLTQAAGPPAAVPEHLCDGTRFKLSFSSKGNVSCLANWRHELDGKWVALVDATNGKHIAAAPRDTGETDNG
jgi:hypothetical protein